MDTRKIIKIENDIREELEAAEKKHPWWPEDKIHAAAVLVEEAGELIQAAIDYTYSHKPDIKAKSSMRKEALQVGAMAIRFLYNLEKL